MKRVICNHCGSVMADKNEDGSAVNLRTKESGAAERRLRDLHANREVGDELTIRFPCWNCGEQRVLRVRVTKTDGHQAPGPPPH